MVILYTIDCPKCNVLEKKLVAAGVDFDVCKDMEVLKKFDADGWAFPILSVDDKLMDFKAARDWLSQLQ